MTIAAKRAQDRDVEVSAHPGAAHLPSPSAVEATAHPRRKLTTTSLWPFALAGVAYVWWALFTDLAAGAAETSVEWWRPALSAALHLPYVVILVFLTFGVVERVGFFVKGRTTPKPGRLPADAPTVCIQLPMYNERAVAGRIIEAAAAMRWPKHRLTIQVLDDSTDHATRVMVREICARIQAETGVTCSWIHRVNRSGYKAGALEAGRRQTDAEYLAIFDADFLPPPDFLQRAMPHFYDEAGAPHFDLALVQAQWGHLNDDQSFLTRAQALWVDDHHTLQQSFRSAAVGFVNFTGTAGVWRASAIETSGGWRSASLVEDCELSFRALFAGFRTRFVNDLVAPAELPQTFDAYRLQQKRWTQGWAQLQRLHLGALLFRYRTSLLRKAYLAYLTCISWQWPLWAGWITIFPFLIAHNMWVGSRDLGLALLFYLAPPLTFAGFAALVATVETKSTYARGGGRKASGVVQRLARVFPYLVVNAGMLPHHLCAFLEGLFGPMHVAFERTPKTSAVTAGTVSAQSALAGGTVDQ